MIPPVNPRLGPAIFRITAVHQAPGLSPAHVAQWITWAGVTVAIIGACEAAPAGSVAAWRAGRRRAHQLRARLAALIPRLRSNAHITGAAAAAVTSAAPAGTVDVGAPWNDSAPLFEKIASLRQDVQRLDKSIGASEQRSRERVDSLRTDHDRAITELRSAQAAIVRRLDEMETREAQTDARGIIVIAGGILLTGLAAQLAIHPLLGLAVVLVVIAAAGRVGFLVIRDWRSQRKGAQDAA